MRMNWERWAAGSGLAFVTLYVLGALIAGEPAAYGDSGGEIVSWLRDNRGEILTATILQGAAGVAYLWYLGALAARVRAAGEARLATTIAVAGVVLAGLALMQTAIWTGLAYGIEQNAEAATVKTLFDLGWICNPMTAWPAAAFAAAVAVTALRAGAFPRWHAYASLAVAAWFVLGGFTFARDGFFAVDGGASFIGTIAFFAWTLVTSGVMARDTASEETAPRPAMASY